MQPSVPTNIMLGVLLLNYAIQTLCEQMLDRENFEKKKMR